MSTHQHPCGQRKGSRESERKNWLYESNEGWGFSPWEGLPLLGRLCEREEHAERGGETNVGQKASTETTDKYFCPLLTTAVLNCTATSHYWYLASLVNVNVCRFFLMSNYTLKDF